MALDNLPAFPDDMYDTAHDGAVPQPVTPRTCLSSRRSLPLAS